MYSLTQNLPHPSISPLFTKSNMPNQPSHLSSQLTELTSDLHKSIRTLTLYMLTSPDHDLVEFNPCCTACVMFNATRLLFCVNSCDDG